MLVDRRRVGTLGCVEDLVEDLLVGPTGGELGLAGFAGSVPVPAAAVRFAVEDVRAAFGRDADRVQPRPVLGVYRVPAGTLWPLSSGAMVLVRTNGPVIRTADRRAVLRPGPQLGGDCAPDSCVSARAVLIGCGDTGL